MKIAAVAMTVVLAITAPGVWAQAAGAGAEYNKREAARMQEVRRLEKYDKPLRDDPIGNALTGGAATGLVRGAAAGAAGTASRAATGTASSEYKRRNEK
ncbi:hypothetical protein [Variovorax sp. 38R]|uniref:hypothetical protein n=1 Tax=Variovorax sp. 38R TaxID=2774875 RepID=UPI001785B508|nr:hypothetical protein [Variovorax sp. 38R]QOF76099.1 hypothetical protein IG196_16970 [Variovorax sp. 38R]